MTASTYNQQKQRHIPPLCAPSSLASILPRASFCLVGLPAHSNPDRDGIVFARQTSGLSAVGPMTLGPMDQ